MQTINSDSNGKFIIEKTEQFGYEKENTYFLSLYIGEETANKEFICRQVNRLRNCFASQTIEFWKEMMDMIYKKGFTEKRLEDAIDNVISTKTSGFITIADVIQYDKCGTRLYTFDWITNNGGNNETSTYNYIPTDFRNSNGDRLFRRCTKEEYNDYFSKKYN